MCFFIRADEENFEPEEFQGKKSDQWEGEDEDEDGLKENWDDEDAQENKEKTEDNEVSLVKKKKSVKQKILEKEEQKKEELLRKAELKKELGENEMENDDEESIFSRNDELVDKLQKQKLVEEADLEVAKETFGISTSSDDVTKSIDLFKPTSKEEFNELAKMIVEKLSQFETSIDYPGFLEILIRDLATGIEVEEVKKLSSVLNVLASEKQKSQKIAKGKKKGKKAVLGGGTKGTKGVDLEDYSTVYGAGGDEYDDFM